jgi:hypothetical protein
LFVEFHGYFFFVHLFKDWCLSFPGNVDWLEKQQFSRCLDEVLDEKAISTILRLVQK